MDNLGGKNSLFEQDRLLRESKRIIPDKINESKPFSGTELGTSEFKVEETLRNSNFRNISTNNLEPDPIKINRGTLQQECGGFCENCEYANHMITFDKDHPNQEGLTNPSWWYAFRRNPADGNGFCSRCEKYINKGRG